MRAGFARSVSVVIAALAFSPCAAEATAAGDWQITQKVDGVTGAKLTNVLIQSSKTLNSRLAVTPSALMQLGCLKGQLLIHLQFAFQVGSKADSEVFYSFDGSPNRRVDARFLRGLKIMVIENKIAVAQFMEGLKSANVLHLVINSMAKGRTSAEFHVASAPAAIEAARAVCH